MILTVLYFSSLFLEFRICIPDSKHLHYKIFFFLDWDRTKAIAASASNTWGLFVLVLMLGYGLVEVPRNCWNRSQKGFQVSYNCYTVDTNLVLVTVVKV